MATSSKPGPEASTRILNAAVRVFAARGYAATSVQELLRGTGYSKPTLYYHFGSKAGLFRAILDFAYDEVIIGEGAVIGAAACVTRDIPANVVAVGIPAKPKY